ncbi:hypothetical protein FSP39_020134 [Pinctada imbricata]|uniref:Uncharacterized protein n=1 Tax=Pinctada imbricata TaxID=66713 RepID=A0AA89BRL0_PINIB|nr:hypothetical protein FSP39_020134 [Pinctada imbricata]
MALAEIESTLCGTWMLQRSENLDEYLKAVGINFVMRKMANSASSTMTISVDKNTEKVRIIIKGPKKETNNEFSLNTEVEIMDPQDNPVKATLTWEDGKLVTNSEPATGSKAKVTKVTREIKDGELVMTINLGEVACKRRKIQSEFVQERNWNQYHTPRNLLLAMMGEVGELAEIFQWRGEVPVGVPDFSEAEKKHLGQEMGDVLLYLIRMAEQCGVDLPQVTMDKIGLNKQKYPVDKVYGKSDKYTAYSEK